MIDVAELRPISVSTEQLLDSTPDGMVIVDADGIIQLVNRQAEALFGYDREELLGQPVEILVPERVQAVHSTHRRGYFPHPLTRPMDVGADLAARRKDGSEFPVDISLSSIDTDQGRLVLAAVRDITERRKFEAEGVRLEARVREVEADEQRTTLEARLQQSERLESIGQLAGGVAHDFNNLLGGIMNYAGLVAATLDDEIAARDLADDAVFTSLAEDVQEIIHVAQRAAALTRQLLIFSRRDVVKLEPVDLNAVVVDMEHLLRRTISEDIELTVDLSPALPRVLGDHGQLEQVLMNLVINARDAMPTGGRLHITTDTVTLTDDDVPMHALAAGMYVRLIVADTGHGMDPEVVARAFEPFFTTKPTGIGTGLGLATVYGIATQAGGDVTIYSEHGLGTTMRVRLPVSGDDAAATTAVVPAAEPMTTGETILLVEDEEIIREPARRTLVRHGYVVLSASGADEALHVLADHDGPIDLLLTDIVMPGRSGKELAADFAVLRPGTPVLFMSGYSHDVIVHEGALDPGVTLIEKPFTADGLLRAVREVLDRSL